MKFFFAFLFITVTYVVAAPLEQVSTDTATQSIDAAKTSDAIYKVVDPTANLGPGYIKPVFDTETQTPSAFNGMGNFLNFLTFRSKQ